MSSTIRLSARRLIFITATALIFSTVSHIISIFKTSEIFGDLANVAEKDESLYVSINGESPTIVDKKESGTTSENTVESTSEKVEESLPASTKTDATMDVIEENEKVCVIHVGPHKTSTTTLQDFMFSKASIELLKKDNYKVPCFPEEPDGMGIWATEGMNKNHAIFAFCLRSKGNRELLCPPEPRRSANMDYFQSFVTDAAMNGSNIILSSEAFDYPDLNIAEMTSYLVPEYKIHVVVYYRRFYDWLHSFYNQRTKTPITDPPEILTFVEWLTDERLEEFHNMFSDTTYRRFKEAQGIFNVSVVNIHEDPDNSSPNEMFACDHLDNAPHLCQLASSQSVKHNNPSIDLNWKVFSTRVSSHHPIELRAKDTRWERIKKKIHQMTDVPQLCLSPNLKNKVLQISLEAETTLTPESWYKSNEGVENLKSDFEGKVNSKLCSMDIETILKSPEWQSFLTELQDSLDLEEQS